MEIYFAVCAGIATLAVTVGVAVWIATLVQMRKAAVKVRTLSEHLDDRVASLRNVGSIIDHFTGTVRSGWVRGAEVALGALTALTEAVGSRGKKNQEEE